MAAGDIGLGRRVLGTRPSRIFGRNRRGSTTRWVEIVLADCEYPDGGWVLHPGITGLGRIFDAELPASLTPLGDPISTPGVQTVVTFPNDGPPKLKVYSEGGFEVEEGWSGESGDTVWVGFVGVS